MAQYTKLTPVEVQTIAVQFGIGEIHSFDLLKGGSENTNYHLCSDKENYVLTICEQKSAKETSILARLLQHLYSYGFTTSKTISTINNNLFGYYKEKPILLKTFIAGEIFEDLPNHLLELVGEQMGKLHKIKIPDYLPHELGYGQTYFKEVAEYAPNSPFNDWIMQIDSLVAPSLALDLPKALIHSDIFPSNIIVSKNEETIVIMDFEEAASYFRVFDLGMAFVGLCRHGNVLDLAKISLILNGYAKEIELTSLEKDSLQVYTVYAAAAMTFWRHKHFNHVKPMLEFEEHYKELQIIADFTRNIPFTEFRKLSES